MTVNRRPAGESGWECDEQAQRADVASEGLRGAEKISARNMVPDKPGKWKRSVFVDSMGFLAKPFSSLSSI